MRLTAVMAGLFMFLALSVILLAQLMGISISNKTLYTSHQPQGTYALRLVRQRQPLNYKYILLVSRSEDQDYGYAATYPESIVDDRSLITRVQWEEKGITIEFPNHDAFFIPEGNYTGGR